MGEPLNSIIWYTGQGAVMLFGWEGNRMHGGKYDSLPPGLFMTESAKRPRNITAPSPTLVSSMYLTMPLQCPSPDG